MRLIDADKLKEVIEKEKDDNDYMCRLCIESTKEIIDEQPTAFDVDEVVQQLEMLIEDKVSESGDDWYTAQCLNEAVEIVKGGGVDGN
jgi:hypothetical protein|nr:MAG TPA: hypothetical protein [Caudoviricetes sp.]